MAKALTIKQPWAWAIIEAGKDVEHRSYRTHYRGPLFIHAGLQDALEGWEFLDEMGILLPVDPLTGGIIGVVWDLSALGLGTYEGWAAIREMFEGWWANWEDHHHKIEEIRDLGHGVVFLVIWEDGRPVGGEGRVHARHGDVNEWVQGKLVRTTSSYDIDEARAVAERLAEERG